MDVNYTDPVHVRRTVQIGGKDRGTTKRAKRVASPVTGERILNENKVIDELRQPHSPGRCGRCLGKSFDTTDRNGVTVWYCGKCDVAYYV